ncbi:DUF6463 family protein [Bacteroides sp.]|uniref:DUF6463 family protein n=1 Tax=Bacteroides sp. TaxID=29523 RepID=UPI0039C149D4
MNPSEKDTYKATYTQRYYNKKIGCIVEPISRFWLFLPQALTIILSNARFSQPPNQSSQSCGFPPNGNYPTHRKNE